MKMKKVIIALFISSIMSGLLIGSALAADGLEMWIGKVDFWVSRVDTRDKENSRNTTHESFTGSPYNKAIYIYLTQRNSASDGIVSAKTKFKTGDIKNSLSTSAIKTQVIELHAAREYILDTQVQLYGYWNP